MVMLGDSHCSGWRMTTPDGQLQHCAKPYSGPFFSCQMSGRHRTMKHRTIRLEDEATQNLLGGTASISVLVKFFPSCFQDPMPGRTVMLSD